MFTVFENPFAQTGRRIDLRVVVLPATTGHSRPDPIVYFAGGPGGVATDNVRDMAVVFSPLNRTRDIVFVDQRGTGGSHKLTCPAAADVDLTDPAQLSSYVTSCLRRLNGDPRFYTTAMASDDMAAVLHALGYARANLYGGSYGATIAQVFERRHRDTVRSMVLLGGTLLDVPIFEWLPRNSQAALNDVFARCAAEAGCRATFPQLRREWRTLTGELAVAPVTVPADRSPDHKQFVLTSDVFAAVIHQLLLTADDATKIPLMVHALATTHDRVSLVATYASELADLVDGSDQILAMVYTIRCNENWARFDPTAVRRDGSGSFELGTTLANANYWRNACALWPSVGARANYRPASISDTPVLIFNGTADPQDPPRNMAGAQRLWPNSRQLVEPHQSHSSSQWYCHEAIIDAFIEHPSVRNLASRCLATVPLPTFQLTPD